MMRLHTFTILLVLAVSAKSAPFSFPALELLESLGLPSISLNNVRKGEQIRKGDSPIYYIKLPPAAPMNPFSNFQQNSIDTYSDHGDGLDAFNSFSQQSEKYQADPLLGSQDIVGFDEVGGSLDQWDYEVKPSTESPFQKVPIEFTNNGRPNQIFHWSRPTQSDSHYQFIKTKTPAPATTPTTTSTTTTTTTPKPTTYKPFKVPEISTSWPPHPDKFTTKKPWASFIKQFSANGKPTGLYIYKSKPIVRTYQKYKHPAFRHFNY